MPPARAGSSRARRRSGRPPAARRRPPRRGGSPRTPAAASIAWPSEWPRLRWIRPPCSRSSAVDDLDLGPAAALDDLGRGASLDGPAARRPRSPGPASSSSSRSRSSPRAAILTASPRAARSWRAGSVRRKRDVHDDRGRLVERAHEVLALGQVHRRLAADRRVDLGDERRRDVDHGHAAEVGRGEEAGRVAERPAADRHERVAALDAQAGQLAGRRLHARQALRRLAARQQDALDRQPGRGEPVGEPRRRPPPTPAAPRRGSPGAPRGAARAAGTAADGVAVAELVAARSASRPGGAPSPPRAARRGAAPASRRSAATAHDRVHPQGRGVEAGPGRGELAHRPDRVAARRASGRRVRAAPQRAGRGSPAGASSQAATPAAVEEPAVARVDRGAAAGGDDAGAGPAPASAGPERRDGRPLASPEAGLALLVEDRRDRPPGRRLDHLVEVDELGAVARGRAGARPRSCRSRAGRRGRGPSVGS